MGSCPPLAARKIGKSMVRGRFLPSKPGVALIELSHKVTVDPVSSRVLTVWSPSLIMALGWLCLGARWKGFQHINEVRQVRILWGNELPTSIPRVCFPTAETRTCTGLDRFHTDEIDWLLLPRIPLLLLPSCFLHKTLKRSLGFATLPTQMHQPTQMHHLVTIVTFVTCKIDASPVPTVSQALPMF